MPWLRNSSSHAASAAPGHARRRTAQTQIPLRAYGPWAICLVLTVVGAVAARAERTTVTDGLLRLAGPRVNGAAHDAAQHQVQAPSQPGNGSGATAAGSGQAAPSDRHVTPPTPGTDDGRLQNITEPPYAVVRPVTRPSSSTGRALTPSVMSSRQVISRRQRSAVPLPPKSKLSVTGSIMNRPSRPVSSRSHRVRDTSPHMESPSSVQPQAPPAQIRLPDVMGTDEPVITGANGPQTPAAPVELPNVEQQGPTSTVDDLPSDGTEPSVAPSTARRRIVPLPTAEWGGARAASRATGRQSPNHPRRDPRRTPPPVVWNSDESNTDRHRRSSDAERTDAERTGNTLRLPEVTESAPAASPPVTVDVAPPGDIETRTSEPQPSAVVPPNADGIELPASNAPGLTLPASNDAPLTERAPTGQATWGVTTTPSIKATEPLEIDVTPMTFDAEPDALQIDKPVRAPSQSTGATFTPPWQDAARGISELTGTRRPVQGDGLRNDEFPVNEFPVNEFPVNEFAEDEFAEDEAESLPPAAAFAAIDTHRPLVRLVQDTGAATARSINESQEARPAWSTSLAADPLGLAPIGNSASTIRPPAGELPPDLAAERFAEIGKISETRPRADYEKVVYWDASAVAHRALLFEEPNLERHGHQVPLVQPIVSGAHFFATVPALPYLAVAEQAHQCRYALGHYRPGNCAPLTWHLPRFSADAGTVEAATLTALILALP